MSERCPGQDRRKWLPEDTTEARCPKCNEPVEFMKDEFSRKCPKCGTSFGDPDKDMGCAQWCASAKECLGVLGGDAARMGIPTDTWRCSNCGHVYDPKEGDSAVGITAGRAWKEMPSEWKCPVCGASRGQFREVLL